MRAAAILVFAAVCQAQTFEVATIRMVDPSEPRGGRPDVKAVPGSVTMRNTGLGYALAWAYKIGPAHFNNIQALQQEHYDITAKAAGPATTDEMRVMMRALLAERFKLQLHRETKEVSAYALVEAKGGHKLTPASAPDGNGVWPVQGPGMALTGQSATLDQLAMFLADPLRAPVIDMTGLKARFDFQLNIDKYLTQPASGEARPDPVAILQTALQKELGLKLEARKLPVEMLIVDHFEKAPAEN